MTANTRLDRYDTEAVGDDVVELPCYLESLLRDQALSQFELPTLTLFSLERQPGDEACRERTLSPTNHAATATITLVQT